jgi:hypothetical protein
MAAQLERDLVADFGPLSTPERQAIFARRYAARADASSGLEKNLNNLLSASKIGEEAQTARAYVEVLTSGYRTAPERAETIARVGRGDLLDLTGTGRHLTEHGELTAVRTCFLREVQLAEMRANAVVYMSPDAFQTGTLSLPITTPGLRAFQVVPASGTRDLSGVLRPDRLKIGQRVFQIDDGAKVPTVAEAASDPAKADALALHIAQLLVLARNSGPADPSRGDTSSQPGTDIPPSFVLTSEDEMQGGGCFLADGSDRGAPERS